MPRLKEMRRRRKEFDKLSPKEQKALTKKQKADQLARRKKKHAEKVKRQKAISAGRGGPKLYNPRGTIGKLFSLGGRGGISSKKL